jgi:hypothetical protein
MLNVLRSIVGYVRLGPDHTTGRRSAYLAPRPEPASGTDSMRETGDRA